jgi:hypothetical protein
MTLNLVPIRTIADVLPYVSKSMLCFCDIDGTALDFVVEKVRWASLSAWIRKQMAGKKIDAETADRLYQSVAAKSKKGMVPYEGFLTVSSVHSMQRRALGFFYYTARNSTTEHITFAGLSEHHMAPAVQVSIPALELHRGIFYSNRGPKGADEQFYRHLFQQLPSLAPCSTVALIDDQIGNFAPMAEACAKVHKLFIGFFFQPPDPTSPSREEVVQVFETLGVPPHIRAVFFEEKQAEAS